MLDPNWYSRNQIWTLVKDTVWDSVFGKVDSQVLHEERAALKGACHEKRQLSEAQRQNTQQ